jgi:mono/diheme cytochrome c family protein
MKKLIFTAIISITFFACNNESENDKTQIESLAKSMLTIDGKALFQANCASCHNPVKDATGPALKGALARVPNKQWIYDFVHNSGKVIYDGDKYANELYIKWNKTAMLSFPNLSNEEIDAILNYCEE